MTDEKPTGPKKSSFNFASLMAEIGIFLLNIFLPVLIAGGILFLLASLLNFWKLDRTFASVIFAILLVVVSFFISIIVSGFRKKKIYRSRLVVMVVGGILVPLLVFITANMLPVVPGETYMARAIQLVSAPPVDVSMVQLGSTVISSHSYYTKVAGIKAIGATHSPAAMGQLFQVLNQDGSVLNNWQTADALSKAIAAYGSEAKSELIATFQKHAQSGEFVSGNQPTNLYDRYFADSLDGLQSEIKAQSLNDSTKQDQLQRFSTLADQIKSSLNDLQSKSLLSSGGDPVLNFIFDTFLQMKLTTEDGIVSFAKSAAFDAKLPDSTRGKALLLLAKLGGKEEMPVLYQFLTSSSEVVKANALDAISNLNLKLNDPTKSK